MVQGNPDYLYDAFISYSDKDSAWVENVLLKRIEDKGFKVCIHYRDFMPGLQSVKNMQRAVMTSRRTLLVITPNYVTSSWTAFEAALVQTADPSNEHLRLIPLVREKCNFVPGFTPLTYLNFADPKDEDLEWERLFLVLEQPSIKEQPALPEISRLKNCMKVIFPTDQELRDLCFVHYEEVYRNLRDTDRWGYIAREIISFCMSRGTTDALWDAMRQRNPKCTAEHEE